MPTTPTALESLERRSLFSVSLVEGVLWALADRTTGQAIVVGYNADASRIRVLIDGVQVGRARASRVSLVVLEGNAGNDTLRIDQSLAPFAHRTLVVGWLGDDVIEGGDADTFVLAGGGDDSVTTGAGDDALFGGYGDDTLSGGGGGDLIYGGANADSIAGGDGDDTIFAHGYPQDAGDTVTAGNGNDSIGIDVVGAVDAGQGTDAVYPVPGSTATITNAESSSPRTFVQLGRSVGAFARALAPLYNLDASPAFHGL